MDFPFGKKAEKTYVDLYQLTVVCHCASFSEINYRLLITLRNNEKFHTAAQICTRNTHFGQTAAQEYCADPGTKHVIFYNCWTKYELSTQATWMQKSGTGRILWTSTTIYV